MLLRIFELCEHRCIPPTMVQPYPRFYHGSVRLTAIFAIFPSFYFRTFAHSKKTISSSNNFVKIKVNLNF